MGPYVAVSIPGPIQASQYNDDVTIPHYVACSRAYAGTKRKCIRGERPEALSVEAHVRAAREAPFFLSREVELPHTLIRAVEFMAWPPMRYLKLLDATCESPNGFTNKSKTRAPKMARMRHRDAEGVTLADPVMLTFLPKRFGLGGSRWLEQLVF